MPYAVIFLLAAGLLLGFLLGVAACQPPAPVEPVNRKIKRSYWRRLPISIRGE